MGQAETPTNHAAVAEQRAHLVGPRAGGDVEVFGLVAEQEIAHASAHQIGRMPVARETLDHLGGIGVDPLLGNDAGDNERVQARCASYHGRDGGEQLSKRALCPRAKLTGGRVRPERNVTGEAPPPASETHQDVSPRARQTQPVIRNRSVVVQTNQPINLSNTGPKAMSSVSSAAMTNAGLRRLAGQVLVAGFPGTEAPEELLRHVNAANSVAFIHLSETLGKCTKSRH